MMRWVLRLRLVAHVVVELLLISCIACRALSFIRVGVAGGQVGALLVVGALARELGLLHGVKGGSGVLLLELLL